MAKALMFLFKKQFIYNLVLGQEGTFAPTKFWSGFQDRRLQKENCSQGELGHVGLWRKGQASQRYSQHLGGKLAFWINHLRKNRYWKPIVRTSMQRPWWWCAAVTFSSRENRVTVFCPITKLNLPWSPYLSRWKFSPCTLNSSTVSLN